MNISGECTQDMIDFSVTLALLRGGYKTHSEVFTSVCLLKWRVINPKTRQLAFTLENKKSVDPIVTHFMATEVVLFLNCQNFYHLIQRIQGDVCIFISSLRSHLSGQYN